MKLHRKTARNANIYKIEDKKFAGILRTSPISSSISANIMVQVDGEVPNAKKQFDASITTLPLVLQTFKPAWLLAVLILCCS